MTIKKEHLDKVHTVSKGGEKRSIEVYEGMPKEDIDFLKKNAPHLFEEKPKAKKYKAVEQPKENENTDEENGEA